MGKRGIIVSDFHCGHLVGLTPPAYQMKRTRQKDSKRNKYATIQRDLWREYCRLSERHGPYDFGLYLGDGIDGDGKRSGGSEIICPVEDQCDMAVECCDQVRLYARRGFSWVGVYGTPYHTGEVADSEDSIADGAGFKKIGSHEWVSFAGGKFVADMKHKVGSSTVPHGRHTAIARENLWSHLWAEREMQPRAENTLILRGHVHYHSFCGGPGWVAMTAPALMGTGSKYGSRQCSGIVDWGVTVIEIDKDGSFDWHCETVRIKSQRAEAIEL
jgi:hypothetical protein